MTKLESRGSREIFRSNWAEQPWNHIGKDRQQEGNYHTVFFFGLLSTERFWRKLSQKRVACQQVIVENKIFFV